MATDVRIFLSSSTRAILDMMGVLVLLLLVFRVIIRFPPYGINT